MLHFLRIGQDMFWLATCQICWKMAIYEWYISKRGNLAMLPDMYIREVPVSQPLNLLIKLASFKGVDGCGSESRGVRHR